MLREKIRDSIRLRFMLAFIGTMLVAALFTFPTVLVAESWRAINVLESQLTQCADHIGKLSEETDLSAARISYFARTENITVSPLEEGMLKGTGIPEDELNSLGEGDYILIGRWWQLDQQLVLRCAGRTYLLTTTPETSQFAATQGIALRVLWASVLIGSLLMLLTVRTVTEPVRRLNEATNRVAQGDFDVRLPETAGDEIGRLTRNFNRMTEQLKKMETQRSDFIAALSHEFKTPLASIQGFAKLLQKEDLPREKVLEYTDIIVEESTRMTTLSSNILRLSALENRTIPHKAELFDLTEQVRRAILSLQPQWEAKDIEMDPDLDEMHCYGDRELLQQVWINLTNNAIKFSAQGGTIHLSLHRGHGRITFICRDEGIGISKEAQERIFDKFYQADASRAREGSGLGLAIVKQIVDLCGGTVTCDSEPGKGTAFTVTLPDRQPPALGKGSQTREEK